MVHLNSLAPPGPTPASQTDSRGQFTFANALGGDWQVQPQKSGDLGSSISALDASYILEAAVGTRLLSSGQRMACDVTGNGSVSALDASLILQYKVGLISSFPVAQNCGSDWVFVPSPAATSNQLLVQPHMTSGSCQAGAIQFQPLAGQATNQDFSAMVFGDCTGNWQPIASGGAAGLTAATQSSARVFLGRARHRGSRVRIPVYVQGTPGFQALDLQVYYDASVLSARAVHRAGNAHSALVQANRNAPSLVTISLASSEKLPSGLVLILEFDARQHQSAQAAVSVLRATAQ